MKVSGARVAPLASCLNVINAQGPHTTVDKYKNATGMLTILWLWLMYVDKDSGSS